MNEADLQVNIEGVRKHAFKKGISDPKVFALSAKQELEGDHTTSGFGKPTCFYTPKPGQT
ncbi:hypothetical protein [Okeania hirsuta]|uniref:hypothetical protein n=1 Tax=Okeania hirsuta TaxID=1458930 RepID=UPI001961E138|nr:hypothetical protein [Okeania hirsuta]